MYTVKATQFSKIRHAVKVDAEGNAIAIPLCMPEQDEPFGVLEVGSSIPTCNDCIAIATSLLDAQTERLMNSTPAQYSRERHALKVLTGRFRELDAALRSEGVKR